MNKKRLSLAILLVGFAMCVYAQHIGTFVREGSFQGHEVEIFTQYKTTQAEIQRFWINRVNDASGNPRWRRLPPHERILGSLPEELHERIEQNTIFRNGLRTFSSGGVSPYRLTITHITIGRRSFMIHGMHTATGLTRFTVFEAVQ